jgi:hypothetical protein
VIRTGIVKSALLLAFVALAVSVMSGTSALAQEEESSLQIDLGFGTGVDRETRNLVGEAVTFPAGTDRIYCRMHMVGAQAPTTVTHAWYLEGKTMAQVELKVGSSNWRTWSSKRLLSTWTGFWEVKVLDPAGKVLATSSFTIE